MPDPTPASTAACCAPLVQEPLSAEDAGQFATGFRALADPVRLRLLSLICAGGDTSAGELAAAFAVTGPTISHHLKVLREAGLVETERRGTSIRYRTREEAMSALSGLLAVPLS